MFDWNHTNRAQSLFFVFFYAILTNIPFWAASHWLDLLPLGWLCLEYAGVGLLALFLPQTLAAALLLLVIAADLISGVSKTYYLSPTECLSNFTSLHQLPASRLIVMVAVAFLILCVAAIAAYLPVGNIRTDHRGRTAAGLIVFMAVALSVDCGAIVRETGRLPNPFQMARPGDANKYSDLHNLWISRYPVIRLVRDQKLFGHARASASQPDSSPVPSAMALALSATNLTAGEISHQPNVVLVLLESWGINQDLDVRNSLVRPYEQPALLARYRVMQGTVPFYGSTIAGEARELCGNNIGYHLLDASSQELRGCLPDRLATSGYHAIALHGMDGHMFKRSSWYTTIGFQERWFKDSFREQGLLDCGGAFIGTCDAAIAEWIAQRLDRKDANPQFVHWMTLNSHLPVPIPAVLPAGAPCSPIPSLAQQPALCSWYQLVANVHDSVSRIAMSKLARPTVFVIVGDHAPPFASPTLRSQFSSTDVPYVLLLPRSYDGPRM
jgi:Sulfatase